MAEIEGGEERRGEAVCTDPAEPAAAARGAGSGGSGDGDDSGGSGDGAGGNSGASSGGSGARGAVAAVIGVIGELLITAGLVLALFVVYSLWWTNVLADREAQRAGSQVRDGWEQRDEAPGAIDIAGGIGFLHVPSMSGSEVLVKKGTDPDELNQGIAGYYTTPVKSALPQDQSGNFSLAAHRDGHGAKFHNIDKIKKGDPVVFETRNTWFVYKVYAILPQTSRYNVDVLDEIPRESGKTEAGRYITLTTCTPVYTSKYRYVVWGELERTQDIDADRTPPRELR